ncbi:MAG: SpoVR family protein, partial [Chitinivibrionales bacterium]|nr:SpoVR family protein [Chitinivibrionales bacterium]
TTEYVKEIERYNQCFEEVSDQAEESFLAEVRRLHPEFDALYKKYQESISRQKVDLMQFIIDNSIFLKKNENSWIKPVIEIVRKTSLFFQPQIRTKIMNEGWASYWHEKLFLSDDRIAGHEVDFSRINAGVTAMPMVGLNPYALGMRLFQNIEEMVNKGKYTLEFNRITDAQKRQDYDRQSTDGKGYIFTLRENYCDFSFINTFIDQDFVTRFNLFVAGKRLNQNKMVWEYYIKSKKAQDYRQMILDNLYHPPHITIDFKNMNDNTLALVHHFEGKSLVTDFIANTMLGIEYLWGGPVTLETHEVDPQSQPSDSTGFPTDKDTPEPELKWNKVQYTMSNKALTRKSL